MAEEPIELPDGYARDKLIQIIETAKTNVETEYGTVYMPEIFKEQLIDYCRELAKDYSGRVAYEEMKRKIIEFITVR